MAIEADLIILTAVAEADSVCNLDLVEDLDSHLNLVAVCTAVALVCKDLRCSVVDTVCNNLDSVADLVAAILTAAAIRTNDAASRS